MKNVFEKHGILKTIGVVFDIIGILLLLCTFSISSETVTTALGLTGIILVILGTYSIMLKNIKEKHTNLGFTGSVLIVLSLILVAISVYITNGNSDLLDANMAIILIGALLFIVGGFMLSLTAKEHRLAKSLLVIILATILLTWLVPYGYFSGSDFYEYGMQRIGIMDVSVAMYNALYYSVDKIVFLFVVAGFYGVLSKVSGYQKLVSSLAKKFTKHPILVSVIMSVFLFVLTSLLNQTLIVMLFIPLFISILLNMNIDKLTAFAITFGSALVGILGATYGTEDLTMFNYYVKLDITIGLTYRFIIAAVALVLYNFFICMRLKKVLAEEKNDTKNADIEDDPFKIEVPKKKVSAIPAAIVLFVLAIVAILCHIAWNTNFGITAFAEFHDWLIELAPTEDFQIISYILGNSATAFGEYTYVFALCFVVVLAGILVAYLYKMKLNDFMEAFYNGTKKIFKPIVYIVAVYLVFGLCYNTPFVAAITNWMYNLVEGFNPYLTSVMAFITSIFHNDLGYTSFTVGSFLTSVYATNIDLVHAIYTSMYGIVQIFMPTSFMLVLGLSLMKLDYKSWFKYIWMFVVGMVIILLVLFTVVTYI